MSSLRSRVNAELQAMADKHGTLKQEQIVEAAREEGTALHEDFSRNGLWDDAVAAHRARLDYAARLIRVYFIRTTDDQKDPVRALVSIIDDRKPESGFPGYRRIGDVMADPDLRDSLVQTALMDLRACRRKYEQLKELAKVWEAIAEADAEHSQPKPSATEQRVSA